MVKVLRILISMLSCIVTTLSLTDIPHLRAPGLPVLTRLSATLEKLSLVSCVPSPGRMIMGRRGLRKAPGCP